jgi:hypothetical protein
MHNLAIKRRMAASGAPHAGGRASRVLRPRPRLSIRIDDVVRRNRRHLAGVLTFKRIVQILEEKHLKKATTGLTGWEDTMPTSRRTLLKTSAAAAAAFSLDWTRAQAQAETLRIGVIYDLTGPFGAGGSVASSFGAQIAIDPINEKGGTAKYGRPVTAVPRASPTL